MSLDLTFPIKMNMARMLFAKAVLTVNFDASFPTNSCVTVTVPGYTGKLHEICEEESFVSPYEINVLLPLTVYAAHVNPRLDEITLRLTPSIPYQSPDGWQPPEAKLRIEYAEDNDGSYIIFLSR